MKTEDLIAALESWAPLVSSGYEVPAAGQVMLEAARRLALAEELIDDMAGHDGAEGFSVSTYKLLDKWDRLTPTPDIS
jgi:hypothetical protein